MPIETQTRSLELETREGDGLFAVALRAAKAAATDEFDSGGMLRIVPDPDSGDLELEVAFSEEGFRRAITKLDVRVSREVEAIEAPLVEAATAGFGGTEFTNLCFATPGASEAREDLAALGPRSEDAFDITVTYPSRIPFYAKNLALCADRLSPEERTAAAACLAHLGVSHREQAAQVRVGTHQLRGRMNARQQAESFIELTRRDLDVALYTSRIPATQSVRVVQRCRLDSAGKRLRRIEVSFSRGLGGTDLTTEEQVGNIEAFITQWFAIPFGARRWRIESRRWMLTADAEPTIPRGRR